MSFALAAGWVVMSIAGGWVLTSFVVALLLGLLFRDGNQLYAVIDRDQCSTADWRTSGEAFVETSEPRNVTSMSA